MTWIVSAISIVNEAAEGQTLGTVGDQNRRCISDLIVEVFQELLLLGWQSLLQIVTEVQVLVVLDKSRGESIVEASGHDWMQLSRP